MQAGVILILDILAAKARLILLFLMLCFATVIMQMVLAGAGWFVTSFVGFIGLLIIMLFWFLVRFWLGVADQFRGGDV